MGFKDIKKECISDLIAMQTRIKGQLAEREELLKEVSQMQKYLDHDRRKLKFLKVLIRKARKIQTGDLV